MSMLVIEKQISRFLSSETPEVLSIKGAWGVGKTFAWNRYLNQARQQKRIALPQYAYVSLFGIDTLDDLKFSIFRNLQRREHATRKPSVPSFRSNIATLLKSFGDKPGGTLPFGRSVRYDRAMINALAFLSLDKALICIDDFERKGRNIAAQDILGLISQLKEEKKCKVALILNDESLTEDSSLDYVRLREKVIDTELRFAPTARDCVDIALNRGEIARHLESNILKLGINNIRIIKKIETLAAQLVPLLKAYDGQVLERALKSLTLLTWSYYSQSEDIPEYRFIISRTNVFADLDDEQSLTTQQQGWCAILRRYDDFVMDCFDEPIAGLVENGFVDGQQFKTEAALLNEKVRSARSEDSFQNAWRVFHDSFDDNADELIDTLSRSFRTHARYITPVNLDGAVRLLRSLGRDNQASRIIDLYIEKRSADADLFNLEESMPGQIKDPEVLDKFHRQQELTRRQRSLAEICNALLDEKTSRDDDELQLSQAPLDEFVSLFKTQRGTRLSQYVDLCLKYSRYGGITEEQKRIVDKAVTALQLIGRESRLNASRVRRFGVRIDNQGEG